jgi:hypothetical protein
MWFEPKYQMVFSDAWLVDLNIKAEGAMFGMVAAGGRSVCNRSVNRKLFANLPGRGYMDVITVSPLQ